MARLNRASWFGLKRVVKRLLQVQPINGVMGTVARALLTPVRRARLPAPAKPVTGQAGTAQFVMLHPERCTVAKELYWTGGRRARPEEARAIEIAVRLTEDSRLFVDIGAYTGIFSLAVASANPSIRVRAYELVPEIYEVLFRNVVWNNLLQQVSASCAGVSTESPVSRVPVHAMTSSLPTSLSTRSIIKSRRTVNVPNLGLNDILRDSSAADNVTVKVDVEGTEVELFDGGRASIERLRPRVICEVLASQPDAPILDDLFTKLDYRFATIGPDRIEARERLQPIRGRRDWLLIPSEHWAPYGAIL